VFVTVTGRAVLAPASGNSKDGCAVLERLRRTVAPEFATREGMVGYLVRYFEYLWLVTGLRVDSEIIADGDDPLHDLQELNPARSEKELQTERTVVLWKLSRSRLPEEDRVPCGFARRRLRHRDKCREGPVGARFQ
jgi:hypothetical protein